MNTIKGKLKFQSQHGDWWVHWGAYGEKSQMIDKSIDTSKFIDGDTIEFDIQISAIEERYRAFPI